MSEPFMDSLLLAHYGLIVRLRGELEGLSKWAREQGHGNPFAEQVNWWALSHRDRLDKVPYQPPPDYPIKYGFTSPQTRSEREAWVSRLQEMVARLDWEALKDISCPGCIGESTAHTLDWHCEMSWLKRKEGTG